MRVVLSMGVLSLCATAACVSPAPEGDKPAPAAKRSPMKIEWERAGKGPVAPLVQAELARAQKAGRRVLVYIGASWCEPCRRFHDAVQRGELDEPLGSQPGNQLGGLRFLEFDLDDDVARLLAAGYSAKLIPLIALPAADGRASGKQMEGSIKGDGAVGQMVPRLVALLREPL